MSYPPPSSSGAPGGRQRTRGRRGFWVTGTVLAGAALVIGVIGIAQVIAAAGGQLIGAMTADVRTTPVTAELDLSEGRWTVFELTGRAEPRDAQVLADDQVIIEERASTVTPELVTVLGPDGQPVEVQFQDLLTESLIRGQDAYSGNLTFTVVTPGFHTISIDSPETTQVIVAPAAGSGFGDALPWLLAAVAAGPLLLVGAVLVIIGVAWRRPVA